jgi:hypothetical protein
LRSRGHLAICLLGLSTPAVPEKSLRDLHISSDGPHRCCRLATNEPNFGFGFPGVISNNQSVLHRHSPEALGVGVLAGTKQKGLLPGRPWMIR